MKIYKEVIQGSKEWFDLRRGKMTGSHAQAIAEAGKGLETYIFNIMADYFADKRDEGYTGKDMMRGNEYESEAREEYERQENVTVKQVAFIERDKYIGVSPDGLVGRYGGTEFKCHNNKTFLKLLLEEKIDKKYWWQIQDNLLISKRKWWDYGGFNKNYKQKLKIIRFYPDEEAFEKLEKGYKVGKKLIKEYINKFNKLK